MKADTDKLAKHGKQALVCYLCKRAFKDGQDIGSYSHKDKARVFRHLDCAKSNSGTRHAT